MKLNKYGKFAALFLMLALSRALCAFAADPPPLNASSDVIEKKIREEARKELIPSTPPKKVEPKVERPAESKDKVRFVAREIKIRFSRNVNPDMAKKVDLSSVEAVIKQYQGRQVSFDDLSGMNQKIEAVLRQQGYFALAYTPPQRVEKGLVYTEILVSRMGEVKVEGSRYFRAAKTASYLKMPKGEMLLSGKLQEAVQAMNENPDRVVTPILRAGKEPGTTDIILKSKERLPLHAGASFDNQGSKVTGKQRYGFTARHNNLLSLDDQFLAGTVFGRYFAAFFVNHALPLTHFGTRLVTGFTNAHTTPQKEFAELGINGSSQTYSLALYQSILRKEQVKLDTHFGIDFKEKSTRTQNETTAWDRLRVLNWGVDYQALDKKGFWTLGQGLHWSVSPHGDGHPLTSRGAESNFFKYTFSIHREQRLPWQTKGVFNFEGQLSPSKLPPGEEIFLGGAGSVRGYPESDYGADQGLIVNLEYWIPFFVVPAHWSLPHSEIPLRQQIQLIAFLDHGYGRLTRPGAAELRSHRFLGAGGGVVIRLNKHMSARLEWASSLGDDALTEGGSSQIHFRLQTDV